MQLKLEIKKGFKSDCSCNTYIFLNCAVILYCVINAELTILYNEYSKSNQKSLFV